eukprot:Gb_23601 [translate_table: standard]
MEKALVEVALIRLQDKAQSSSKEASNNVEALERQLSAMKLNIDAIVGNLEKKCATLDVEVEGVNALLLLAITLIGGVLGEKQQVRNLLDEMFLANKSCRDDTKYNPNLLMEVFCLRSLLFAMFTKVISADNKKVEIWRGGAGLVALDVMREATVRARGLPEALKDSEPYNANAYQNAIRRANHIVDMKAVSHGEDFQHLLLVIYGDPEAADIVFTCGAEIVVVGINVTTQVILTDSDLCELRDSKGRHGKYIYDICQFYRDWHVKSDGVHGIFLHDPTCLAALLNPNLFEYKMGAVRVETQGICTGHTLMDLGLKKWNSDNPWTGIRPVSVAWTVDVAGVINLVKELLMKA